MKKTAFAAVPLLALCLAISGCEHFSASRPVVPKAEPKKAEPRKAEPRKAEPRKAEPRKAEPQTATKAPQTTTVPPEPISPDLQAQMGFILRLNESDTAQRNNLYASSKRALEEEVSVSHKLHLAWVLATPGHAYSNPWQAGKQLRELLAEEDMSKDLHLFVRLRLRDIERQQHMLNRLSEAEAKIKALTTLEHSMEQRDAEVQEQ